MSMVPMISSLPSTRALESFSLAPSEAPGADGHEIDRAGVELADQRVLADLGAERLEIEIHQRRDLEPLRVGEADQALRQPPAIVIDAPERIAARLGAADDQPFAEDRHGHRGDVHADVDAEQRGRFFEEGGVRRGEQLIGDEHAEPLRGDDREDERQRGRLRQAAQETPQQRRRREGEIALGRVIFGLAREMLAERAQRAMGVEVLQRDRRQGAAFRAPRRRSGRRAANGRRDR